MVRHTETALPLRIEAEGAEEGLWASHDSQTSASSGSSSVGFQSHCRDPESSMTDLHGGKNLDSIAN